MANYREEQLRNNRRLARQVLGGAALVLALIGLFTVLGWVVAALRTALDDSGRKEAYANRLYGMVMMDVPAFENVEAVDPAVFKQVAIWGTVYQAQQTDTNLSGYERDADTGSAMIPRLEIDTYLANLLGPDYQVPEGGFETEEFNYLYDEETQCYLVPVTSGVAQYTPVVEQIKASGGKTYVTVGYIPTTNNSPVGEVTLAAPTEPTKYMDFVFERGENRQWYLSALQESEMKPETTPVPTATAVAEDAQTMVENQLDSTMTDAVNGEPAPVEEAAPTEDSTAAESTAEGEEAPAEGEGEAASDAAADGETTDGTDAASDSTTE